ncbi:MAG: leucine-rich repeat domain-containing protein [Bacteroidaceae bacterium]|nr:leucine-rich repeat domain-containing protein [Bacteroidaceae bacterium]
MRKKLLSLALMALVACSAWAQSPNSDYLCFTANTAGSTVELVKNGDACDVVIQFSTNHGDSWQTVDFSIETTTGVILLNDAGDKVYFRNAADEVATGFSLNSNSYYQFKMSGNIAASGNVMSLIDKRCGATTIPCAGCFCCLFYECQSLISAPELPATTLTDYCYGSMFCKCPNLRTAPELPATTLTDNCYGSMFHSCTSLKSAPNLPAMTLANNCCQYMFKDCINLESAPNMPAMTLATKCYLYMFAGCTNLKSAPKLPATTLADYCYQYMFEGCTGLKSAPELPATTLKTRCYQYMFSGCTGLTSAPELPATTLATATYCYSNMFEGCTGLTSAPELPATTLANYCYQYMFKGCTGLKTAPELPATTLKTRCYYYMLQDCTSLNNISVVAVNATNSKDWVKGVSSSGTFACPSTVTTTSPGTSANPVGWTVKNSYDLTITDAGWASMCVNLPLQVPTGVEVYYASAVDGSTITLTQIEAGTKIATKTAVLVKGTGTVSFPIMGEAGTAYTDNLFVGTSVDKAFNADKNGAVYVLSQVDSTGKPLFQNYVGTTLGAHKIWLPASAVGDSNVKELHFVFDSEKTTGINVIERSDNSGNGMMYNLNGMRVDGNYKGIVIMNGKKVYNK